MVATHKAFGSTEIIQVADAVAREKGIAKESVLDAMADAIQIAGRRKYGFEHHIKAEIDHKTGEILLYKVTTVVDEVEDDHTEITEAEAKRLDPELKVGDEIKDPLPPIDFGRIAAQTAKQVIVQKVRDAERERQFEEFKDRIGEVVSGIVKRIEYGNIAVDLGRTEAVIRRDDMIPRENYRQGDRVRAYIYDVRRERTGPQIFLSRTHPDFMTKLFAQEVPEIYDGIIEIKSVARDPGSRAKIAVMSNDYNVNPVLSCVGVRGSRVQAVVNELQGEKIDIVEWAADPATFIVNALSSAEVSKVVIDEGNSRIEVVVPDDQLSLAIGRRGQNVRLASQLTGWNIDILTEDAESSRRADEFNNLSQMFVDALNVEEVIAHLLVTEGFTSIEEVAFVPAEDLVGIEGFDEDISEELRSRARDYLDAQKNEQSETLRKLGVAEDLLALELVPYDKIVALAEQGVKTRDDLAELARDEFMEMLPDSGYSEDEVDAIIMKAREHWFEGEEDAAAAEKKEETADSKVESA